MEVEEGDISETHKVGCGSWHTRGSGGSTAAAGSVEKGGILAGMSTLGPLVQRQRGWKTREK